MKSNQRLANKIMVGTLALSLVAGSISIGDTNRIERFKDMNTHWSSSFVLPLAEQGVIGGYADGTFKPDNNIKRIEYIVLTLKAIGETMRTTEPGEYWGLPYIEKAIELGLVDSTSTESSDYEKLITRQEMASIIIRAYDKDHDVTLTEGVMAKAEKLIKDISNTSMTYQEEVTECYALNFIGGYPDGTFKPLGNATRAESSVVIAKLLDESLRTPIEEDKPLENSGTAWYDYVHSFSKAEQAEMFSKGYQYSYFEDGVLYIDENDSEGTFKITDDYTPDYTARLNNLFNYMVHLGRMSVMGNTSIGEETNTVVTLTDVDYMNGNGYFHIVTYNNHYTDPLDNWNMTPTSGATIHITDERLYDDYTVREDGYWDRRYDEEYADLYRGAIVAFFGEEYGYEIADYLMEQHVHYYVDGRRSYDMIGVTKTIGNVNITVPVWFNYGALEFYIEIIE